MTDHTPVSHRPDIQSSVTHLEMLIRKRNKLEDAIEDAANVLIAQVSRVQNPTLNESVALYRWAKSVRKAGANGTPVAQGPRGITTNLAAALGMSINTLADWARAPELPDTESLTCAGVYPVDRQWTPRRGTPCVYALYAGEVLVYVGRSESVRTRLKAHWNEHNRPGGKHDIDNWRVFVCDDLDSSKRLEAELIAQYMPRYNRAGNPFRKVV